MNNANGIKELLDEYPQYRETLFCRGYVLTTREFKDLSGYPFYGQWKMSAFGKLEGGPSVKIYFHKWQECRVCEKDGIRAAIIGHAYNPFDMKYREENILEDCIKAYRESRKAFFDKVSELTGIHLIILNDGESLLAVQDCAGMKACYYGKKNGDIYLASHSQLAGDICGLKVDPFVKTLTGKWFFRFGWQFLPGNLSPFREFRKLGPNTFLELKKEYRVRRFYPVKPHVELTPGMYDGVIASIAELLRKNVELCTLKWKTPAISLSGGVDSRTTFSCANGFYDRLKCYSFHCKPSEFSDAKAASRICGNTGVEHKIYPIPDKEEQIKDYDALKKIISHNLSHIGVPPEREIRKYIYLYRLHDFDVELKSWVSEVGRVIRERKYNTKFPAVLTPRHFSIFQTRYVFAKSLLLQSENYYRKYLREINLEKPLYNYEHTDLHAWEFIFGFWGQNVVTSQDIFSHTVTMPMNNRKLIDMFLWFPHEYRKRDMVHTEVIKHANRKVAGLEVAMLNQCFGKKRVFLERAYYKYAILFNRNP